VATNGETGCPPLGRNRWPLTGGFTNDTQAAARRSSRRITLIDGETLLDLWVEHYDRIDEDGRNLLSVKPVYFLDLDTTAS
jgi:restriction system protein